MTSSHETPARTFALEDGLPRVPLPTLDHTCERFLQWCSPLLTDEQLAETKAAVADFLRPDGPGRRLHAALAEYDAREDVHSWLDLFWPSRYLGRRDRIALNANFFFLFEDSPLGQVERAAQLVAAAVDYKLRLDGERVPPVQRRGQALSMEQNKFLFAATRIPGDEQDTVRAPYSEAEPGPSKSTHILVFHRGNMFRLEVLDAQGRPHSREDLAAGVQAVLKAGEVRAERDTSVGHLTTMARAEWAETRRRLIACDPANPAALEDVESALFCLCLEDTVPATALEACDLLLRIPIYGAASSLNVGSAASICLYEIARQRDFDGHR